MRAPVYIHEFLIQKFSLIIRNSKTTNLSQTRIRGNSTHETPFAFKRQRTCKEEYATGFNFNVIAAYSVIGCNSNVRDMCTVSRRNIVVGDQVNRSPMRPDGSGCVIHLQVKDISSFIIEVDICNFYTH